MSATEIIHNNGREMPDIVNTLAVLIFQLASQEYGLPITKVMQIVDMVAITTLPQMPSFVRGIINYHGHIVPIIDLRLHLGLPFQAYDLHTPIILIDYQAQTLGLVVDDVIDILYLSHDKEIMEDIAIPVEFTDTSHQSQHSMLTKVAKTSRHLILILQIDALLSHQEQLELLKAMSAYEPQEALP